MDLLIDDFLKPEIPPEKYLPASNVIAWRSLGGGYGALEVFRRKSGTFGFQYRVWVAWRDAGNEVQDHGWHIISSRTELMAGTLPEARTLASMDAEELCLELTGEWASVSSDS